jgi:signal transduction histidine kinase
MLNLVLDLLIEQQVPATLWLKIPKGDVWQSELDRYHKLATAPSVVYIFKTLQEEPVGKGETKPANVTIIDEPIPADEEAGRIDWVSTQELIVPKEANYSNHIYLPLITDSQLRREYFLLVVAEEFCGLLLAHRPRSVKQIKLESTESQELPIAKSNLLNDEDLERKHPLLALCTFELQTIQQVFRGIQQATQAGQSQTDSTELEQLLIDWDSLMEAAATKPLNQTLLTHLINKQIQRQEEIWRSSATYRKQAEAASILRMENEELLNAIQMKDEFVKNVGQELRTPLATMKTALTLLHSPNLKPAQRQRYMDMLSHECDRQSSLITSVLDLIQLENVVEQAPLQPLRLSDVVPGVVSTYQPLAQEKGLMLAYTIPEDLPAVACLSASLRQIVINLLHNSIKFTPQGGQVWVRAKQQGDYVQIEFRDTGIGIAAADIPKIFDRFYRIRTTLSGDESAGAGLGLSIVQQLLLRCGGSISVKSKPGEGSTFSVLLPIYR